MLSGTLCSALAMAGNAVLRIVVSSDSMKNATATSHGSTRFADAVRAGVGMAAGAPRPVRIPSWVQSVSPERVQTTWSRRRPSGFVQLQLVVERAEPDAEPLGGASAVAVRGRDRTLDRAPLELRERPLHSHLRLHLLRRVVRRSALLDPKVLGLDDGPVGEDHRALQDVSELAHVAGPRLATEPRLRGFRETDTRGPAGRRRELLDERLRERHDVLAPLA